MLVAGMLQSTLSLTELLQYRSYKDRRTFLS